MKKNIYFLCLLAAVAVMHTSCFLLAPSTSSNSTPAPKVDYAPQQIKSGAYVAFTHPDGASIKIVFQTQSTADLAASSASNGRINAAYYRYDGFNMASLTYNYQPNGKLSGQYKAELNFTRENEGTIRFLDSDQTASFTYRP